MLSIDPGAARTAGPGGLPPDIRGALRRFRSRQRLVRGLRGAGMVLIAAAVLLGLALTLDRYLVLSPFARVLLSAGAWAGAALAAALALLLPLFRPMPLGRAARWLESALPSLEESLITTWEIEENGAAPETSPALVEELARLTAERLRGVDPARLVDRRPARWLWLGAAAALTLISYGAADPRAFQLLIDRFLHPTLDLPRPSRVALQVAPGDAVVGLEDDLLVEVLAIRGSPESAVLRQRVPGGEWRSVPMEAVRATAAGSPVETRFRHELRRLRQSIEYQVVAGDAASAVHRIQVRERPAAVSFDVTYRYPAYTRKPDARSTSPRGDLSAVAGTRAELSVVCAGHPAAARLLGLEDGADKAPLQVAVRLEEGPDGRWRARTELEVRRSGSYRLHLEDADGISNRGGELYSIHAEADRAPRVRLLSPRGAEVAVEETASLEIEYQAQDDFGLAELSLLAGREASSGAAGASPASSQPSGRSWRRELPLEGTGLMEGRGETRTLAAGLYRWNLLALGLRPGETLPFRLVARDALGQEGSTPEILVRVPFVPVPPEGEGWLAGLRGLRRGLDTASEALRALARDGAPAFAVDPARVDRLGVAAEGLLKELARLRLLGDVAGALGRAIPMPSVNQRSMAHLAQSLRRFNDEEGKAWWRELVELSGAVRRELGLREKSPAGAPAGEVSGAALLAAQGRALEKLAWITAQLQAIHLSERLEEALDRARALAAEEEEIIAFARDAPAAADSPALRAQRALRVEATALGAELEGLARAEAAPGSTIEALARKYLESVVPALDAAQGANGRGAEVLPPLEAALRAFRAAEAGLAAELDRAEALAREARRLLLPGPGLSARLASLAAAEGRAVAALASGSRESLAAVANEGDSHRQGLQAARADLEARADAAEKAQPSDFESARDLLSIRDLFQNLLEGGLEDSLRDTEDLLKAEDAGRPPAPSRESVLRERRRAAEMLEGLARAVEGLQPGLEIGPRARLLEAIAQATDGIASRLRSASAPQKRTLRGLARAGRELELGLRDLALELEALRAGLPAVAGEALGAAAQEAARAADAARSASAACLAGDPANAISGAIESARLAEQAAAGADAARARLPDLAGARAWLARRIGSLPERVERLARDQRAHAGRVETLAGGAGAGGAGGGEGGVGTEPAPFALRQPELVAGVGLDQEVLRDEAARVAAAVTREASVLAAAPARGDRAAGIAAVRRLDEAADRILSVSRDEMSRASKSLEEAARAEEAGPQLEHLRRAAADERRAGEILQGLAAELRLLDEGEAAAQAAAELGEALARGEGAPRVRPIAEVLAEARALLEGIGRAAEVLAARLTQGALKAELLDHLRIASEKLREAVEAGEAGRAEEANERLLEGRASLASAIALARRIRGEAAEGLAQADAAAARQGPQKPRSRELDEVYAELEKIQSLRSRQAQAAAELAELLRERSRAANADKLKELAKVEEALAEELDTRFLTTAELVELVADLLAAGKESRRISEAERGLLPELPAQPSLPAPPALAGRQEGLLRDAEAMAKKVRGAGATLTINIPAVLRPFWAAEARLGPALDAMQVGAAALKGEAAKGAVAAAGKAIGKASEDLRLAAELLDVARRKALEEIAARESDPSGGADFGQQGMESAMRSMAEAARQLAEGRLDSAQALQGQASRGLMSASEALRARLERMRLDPGQGALPWIAGGAAGRGGGVPWQVLLRGDEEKAPETEEAGASPAAESLDAVTEEYRQLVRIYLRALAEGH